MAGLGKKTFTAGEVLTAADVNGYLMEQSVMVFGGTAARSSAIPSPSEGMVTYQTDTNQIDAYNGSAWVGMGGLQLVKTQTIGSGVSTVSVTNAFNSNYDNYRIIISGGAASANQVNLSFALTGSSTGYAVTLIYLNYGGTEVGFSSETNASTFPYIGAADTDGIRFNCDIYSPNIAKWTVINGAWIKDVSGGNFNGIHKVATAYTGFTITPSTGTLTGGTIYVYGYAKG